jgi:hypothetical protein
MTTRISRPTPIIHQKCSDQKLSRFASAKKSTRLPRNPNSATSGTAKAVAVSDTHRRCGAIGFE